MHLALQSQNVIGVDHGIRHLHGFRQMGALLGAVIRQREPFVRSEFGLSKG